MAPADTAISRKSGIGKIFGQILAKLFEYGLLTAKNNRTKLTE